MPTYEEDQERPSYPHGDGDVLASRHRPRNIPVNDNDNTIGGDLGHLISGLEKLSSIQEGMMRKLEPALRPDGPREATGPEEPLSFAERAYRETQKMPIPGPLATYQQLIRQAQWMVDQMIELQRDAIDRLAM